MKIDVPTPHNEAKFGDIAKTVLMPGDPLRAKYIAENFLEDAKLYNNVRGMLGYTGKYKGVTISVQGSGMGIPSIAIYSRELYDGYDVENIIRVGSAGSLDNDEASDKCKSVKLGDIIIATDADSDSNYMVSNNLDFKPVATEELLEIAKQKSAGMDNVKFGTIFSSDTFYKETPLLIEKSKSDSLGVEMETFGLYANAKITNKKALAMFTVTDKALKGESMSSYQRQTGLNDMIKLALEIAYELEKDRE